MQSEFCFTTSNDRLTSRLCSEVFEGFAMLGSTQLNQLRSPGLPYSVCISLSPLIGAPSAENTGADFGEYVFMMQQLKTSVNDRMIALASTTTAVKSTVDGNFEAWKKGAVRAEKDYVKGQ